MMKFYAIAALTVGTLFLSSCSLFERQAEHRQSVSTATCLNGDDMWIQACSITSCKEQVFVLDGAHWRLLRKDIDGQVYYLDCRELSFPYDMAVNVQGEIFIADTGNHVIRRISNEGVISIFAGRVGIAGFTDGAKEQALFHWPCGVAVDQQGGIIVADSGNNALRKIHTNGDVETLVGRQEESGPVIFTKTIEGREVTCESRDGDRSVATLRNPIRVAVDQENRVFILCAARDETHFDNMVRRYDPDGKLVTLAGETHVEAQFRDGVGREARFFDPRDVAVDFRGNAYVLDSEAIRRISSHGEVVTVVGRFQSGSWSQKEGDGKNGKRSDVFQRPSCLESDKNGNLYIGDGPFIWQMTPELKVSLYRSF